MMERFENFFMMFCVIMMIIILVAIAWAMWRPILIDANNMQVIWQNLRNHDQAIRNISTDVDLLKRQPVKPATKE